MRLRPLVIIALFLFCSRVYGQNQGINNNWLQGYGSFGGLPFGQTKLDFFNGSPIISYDSLEMDFRHTHANISDSSGNILFYTNGYYIADASHDTMQNGSGINPGAYANYVPDGFLIPQGALAIQKPGSNSEYYLFHNTLDNFPTQGSYAYHLYMTTIDMSLNGGLGAVTIKNYPIVSDSLNVGKITACKHANGRDWWVVCHRVNTNMYYKLLVTPNGITVSSQNIGSVREWDAGQAKFSPDGSRFAYYHYRFTGLDIFDFDRCTGLFSNHISDATIPQIAGQVGCEFSPNSNILYVMNNIKVYQYDLTAANVLATRNVVADWDSFFQPGIPNLGVYLCIPQLAPDGRIYIGSGNGSTYFGIINLPNNIGVACVLFQHYVVLPTYYFNTVPNHPNYFLGADSGSVCDSLTGINVWHPPPEVILKVAPNPNHGIFTLQFPVQKISGELEVFDVFGKSVYKEYVSEWSQYKHVDITHLPAGIYLCKMRWGNTIGNLKVVKQ